MAACPARDDASDDKHGRDVGESSLQNRPHLGIFRILSFLVRDHALHVFPPAYVRLVRLEEPIFLLVFPIVLRAIMERIARAWWYLSWLIVERSVVCFQVYSQFVLFWRDEMIFCNVFFR